jgi:hypothetical protein
MKKLVMVALVVSLMLPLMAQEGQAAYGWFYCNVSQVGANSTGGWFVLTPANGTDFTGGWYQIDPAIAGMTNQILASALTAVANGKQGRVLLDSANVNAPVQGFLLVGP